MVCVGSATLSAAYYASWAPNLPIMAALATFAFVLDLVKPQLFAAAADAARKWQLLRFLVAGCLACLLLVVSMIAVDGMMLMLRTEPSSGKSHVRGAWDRADATHKRAVSELAELGKVEPKAGLEAKLEGSVPVEVWRRTKKCTDVTQKASSDACEPAFAYVSRSPVQNAMPCSSRSATRLGRTQPNARKLQILRSR
jgi:hypothetical protein